MDLKLLLLPLLIRLKLLLLLTHLTFNSFLKPLKHIFNLFMLLLRQAQFLCNKGEVVVVGVIPTNLLPQGVIIIFNGVNPEHTIHLGLILILQTAEHSFLFVQICYG